MSNLIYCEAFTKSSFLANRFLSDLDSLCIRDYGRSFFNKSIMCLDLDAYESSVAGNNMPTIDASVGVADYDANRISSRRHLLVELRFDYKSTGCFDAKNMAQKYDHSRAILMSEGVAEEALFIYKGSVAGQAKNYFKRYCLRFPSMKFWKAVDVEHYNDFVRPIDAFPYEPINDLDALAADFMRKYEAKGIEGVDVLLGYWIGRMDDYIVKYNHLESSMIATTIIRVLDQLSLSPMGSEEKEYISLVKEDLKKYTEFMDANGAS